MSFSNNLKPYSRKLNRNKFLRLEHSRRWPQCVALAVQHRSTGRLAWRSPKANIKIRIYPTYPKPHFTDRKSIINTPRDADGERLGGYVMMDLAMMSKDQRSRRGWVITPLLKETGVIGNCVQFYYAMEGINVESLRLMRVDIETSGDINRQQGDNKTKGEVAEVYSRGIEASFGFDSGEIEVRLRQR